MMWAWLCVAWAAWTSVGGGVLLDDAAGEESSPYTRVIRQQPTFGITHLDIRDAILTLDKSIKDVGNKLNRHEAREAQVADFTIKTLKTLLANHAAGEANTQALARQLATMEERILSTEALILTTDERQRMMLRHLTEGMDHLLLSMQEDSVSAPLLPPHPGLPHNQQEGTVLKHVKKLTRKVNAMDNLIQGEMRKITNEVRIVGESLEGHMSQLHERHERLTTHVEGQGEAMTTSLVDMATALETATNAIRTDIQGVSVSGGDGCVEGSGEEVLVRLDSLDRLYREQEQELHDLTQQTHKSLEDHLTTLQALLQESHTGQAIINASVAHLTHNLGLLNATTQNGIAHFSSQVKHAVEANAVGIKATVSHLGAELKEGNSNIMDILDDRASQAENLQQIVLENYSELSDKISSLKRVEQVMMNTADSVLDTKRSIEFGIQQIILELGEIVKDSGSTINSTLSDQISNISFAILKNQTTALTNMTAKMEAEISQVWRQIGIMYQQMSQSVDLLDQLKDTTKEHMNASLSRVGNMDGTVGKINTKVADVEDNLNYLLGRLSLVVSEFNLMKSGVGDELMRLRENLARENRENEEGNTNNPVNIAGEFLPPIDSRYSVNRKRHAPPTANPYPGFNPELLTVF